MRVRPARRNEAEAVAGVVAQAFGKANYHESRRGHISVRNEMAGDCQVDRWPLTSHSESRDKPPL
ncbi:MAG: hypothetical protein ACUVX8_00055 [Candidatus Zipacnadales bacterium]